MRQQFYNRLIAPYSHDVDQHRREFILNSLLTGLLGIALFATAVASYDFFIAHITKRVSTMVMMTVFLAVIALLLSISRIGYARVSAVLFTIFLLISATLFALSWGFRVAQAELMFALIIVIIGVLFAAPLALVAAGIVASCLLAVAYLQINGYQVPYRGWETKPYLYSDVFGYIIVFIVMGIVSWLSNRETARSLKRARRSEAALAKERDNLEITVAKRTRELEDLQLARLLELQPFAEFGRIGASLVHDIANPLTAVGLHLEELNRQQHSELVKQVQRNFKHLEKYLLAARKQIRRESDLRTFAVGSELKQIVHLLTHRARKAGVRLELHNVSGIKLYGDVVKFDQLIANVIANAIDAYEKMPAEAAAVIIRTTARNGAVAITVSDHGVGITEHGIQHLFEPFYSTKSTARSGLGIGLALVKQYVETDFAGSITVTSTPEDGTAFTITLRGQK